MTKRGQRGKKGQKSSQEWPKATKMDDYVGQWPKMPALPHIIEGACLLPPRRGAGLGLGHAGQPVRGEGPRPNEGAPAGNVALQGGRRGGPRQHRGGAGAAPAAGLRGREPVRGWQQSAGTRSRGPRTRLQIGRPNGRVGLLCPWPPHTSHIRCKRIGHDSYRLPPLTLEILHA